MSQVVQYPFLPFKLHFASLPIVVILTCERGSSSEAGETVKAD